MKFYILNGISVILLICLYINGFAEADHVVSNEYRLLYDSVVQFATVLYDRVINDEAYQAQSFTLPILAANVLMTAVCFGFTDTTILSVCEKHLNLKINDGVNSLILSTYDTFLKKYVQTKPFDKGRVDFHVLTNKYIMIRNKIFVNLASNSSAYNDEKYLNILTQKLHFEIFRKVDKSLIETEAVIKGRPGRAFDLFHKEYQEFMPTRSEEKYNKDVSQYLIVALETGFVINWMYPYPSSISLTEFPFYYLDNYFAQVKYFVKDALNTNNEYPYKNDCKLECELLEIPLKGGFNMLFMVPFENDGIISVEKKLKSRRSEGKAAFPFLEAFTGLTTNYKTIELRILKSEEIEYNDNTFSNVLQSGFPRFNKLLRLGNLEFSRHGNPSSFMRFFLKGNRKSDLINLTLNARFEACLPEVFITLNRPFLFAITHVDTGIPIYYGRITKPEANYVLKLTQLL